MVGELLWRSNTRSDRLGKSRRSSPRKHNSTEVAVFIHELEIDIIEEINLDLNKSIGLECRHHLLEGDCDAKPHL